MTGQDEDAGADGATDAEQDQVERPQGPLEGVGTVGLFLEIGDGLGPGKQVEKGSHKN